MTEVSRRDTHTSELAQILYQKNEYFFLFLFSFFWIPDWREVTLGVAVVLTAFDLAEEIILTALLGKWSVDVPGLFWLKNYRHD